MRLLTLNVHAWQEEHQLDKINTLAKVIHENRYDVIALQEVSQLYNEPIEYDHIRADNYGLLVQKELEKLGSNDYTLYWDVSHYGYDIYEEGLALLVRHPAINVESFYISASQDIDFWKSRKIVGGTFDIKGERVALYSCHLGWWNDEEESYTSQVDRLLNKADEHDSFILMGDFNSASIVKGEGYEYLLKSGLYDTHTLAHTKSGQNTIEGTIAGWDQNSSGLKIDYILTNWGAHVTASRVIFDGENKPVISDHYGLDVDLRLSNNKQK
ncbi:endonuclease/exonuclease/phosphatase family protein [Texcoconibacillus texcoconensis]|uniref:Maltose 6'-phosphate phosphatase n=1 Tax=Texcoconibacillus texcoconensis TaxID=1095777 RepID=A0A840QP64_9BACI|nr:endonuclease/exonuclease/phosphatase family protein [Texcoconibacillus texcoconensis]MBB5173165.1 maltose 6'-phosphate phosphatase [Texcoconibacillus texcoconensis]